MERPASMDPRGGAPDRHGGFDEGDFVNRQQVAGSAAPKFEEVLMDGHSALGGP
jgi:hypothetical protein